MLRTWHRPRSSTSTLVVTPRSFWFDAALTRVGHGAKLNLFMRTRPLVWSSFLVSLLLFPSIAHADVIVFKDGGRLRGKIKPTDSEKYVTVVLPDGGKKLIPRHEIQEIIEEAPETEAVTDKPSPSGGTPPTAPETKVAAEPGREGGSGTVERSCDQGDKACQERLEVQVKGDKSRVDYRKEQDCADSTEERCKRETSAGADAGGLGVKVSETKVTRVRKPTSGATQLTLGGTFLVGFADNFSLAGSGLTAGFRLLSGGLFPDEKGGGWAGFYFEGTASASYTMITIKVPNPRGGTEEQKNTSGALLVGAGAGLQFSHFGVLDPKTLKQEAHGLTLGGQIGRYIPFEGDGSLTYGPSIGYTQNEYNPGTGSVESRTATLFILPTKSFVLFMVGVSMSFGS